MKKITSRTQLICMCLFALVLTSHFAHAQGQAGFIPAEEESQPEKVLTDDVIEKILTYEGIPLTPTSIEDNASRYTLGINDVIDVSVQRHPEVSGQYSINNEGKIQYEFVGDIEIIGMTKDEISDLLKERLSKYIISPELTVKIVGYNSKVVYVIGEVGHPGKIFMRGDTITVREALVQAALPLLSAKTTQSRLITPSEDGHPKQVKVNVHKLLYEGDLRENYVMKPGDTLYIPPTFMAKTLRAIQPIAAPIGTAAGTSRNVQGF